jgi:transketolase
VQKLLCGSHAGVSIGEDGPSQMGLEDIAMMRAVHGSTVLSPCCAQQTVRLVEAMAGQPGIVYLRTIRNPTPILYGASDTFRVGGSRTHHPSPGDVATVVATGVTVHEALAAREVLKADGLSIRIIDAYSIKPIDADSIRSSVAATSGRVVIVEDHWAVGGLGDAVRECLIGEKVQLAHLAVSRIPGSGKPAELLQAAGIDVGAIVDAVHLLAREARLPLRAIKTA